MLENIESQARKLKEVLIDQGIKVDSIDFKNAQVGPSVVRYRVKLSPGSRVSKMRRSAEDIGREMSTETTPIVDNIPGEPFVGIDIARPDRRLTYLTSALTGLPKDPNDILNLPIAAGVTPGGENIFVNLADMPHMLVAGSTASGKTVFLHSIILSLISRLSEKELELIIIDPKETDFPIYKNLPHLRGGKVYTAPGEALALLRSLTRVDMPRRTEILQKAECPNIKEYNAKSDTIMKPIVVIIDEYADLSAILGKKEREAFEKNMTRLAQRARSVGIHLVIATQRPGVQTLSGLLKANIPCRAAFRLPQQVDSRVALDQSGAENLLGKGDMLLKNHEKTIRLQGYFISTEEIKEKLNTMFPQKHKKKDSKKIKVDDKEVKKSRSFENFKKVSMVMLLIYLWAVIFSH